MGDALYRIDFRERVAYIRDKGPPRQQPGRGAGVKLLDKAVVDGQEFIGVQRKDPICREKLNRLLTHEFGHALSLAFAGRRVLYDFKGQAFLAQRMENVQRAIAAAVIEYDELRYKRQRVPDKRLDDVGFIFGGGNGDNAHSRAALGPSVVWNGLVSLF